MAQFGVRRNPDPHTEDRIPFLLDVQTDLLDSLTTRIVVPLTRSILMKHGQRLNPAFVVQGITVYMCTAELAAVRLSDLGELVGSLADRRDDIIAALDFLFTGI